MPKVGRYGPVHAAEALSDLGAPLDMSPAAGGAVLVAWAAALALAGVVLTAPRDVD